MKTFLCRAKSMLMLFVCLETVSLVSCSDNEILSKTHDPNKSIEVTDFSPKNGQARTRLYVFGKNFGTDVSQIHVKVGGVPANVIGSDGEIIYCIVAPKSYNNDKIEVAVGQTDNYTEAPSPFKYAVKKQVKTLCGYVDETGKTEATDGSFDVAGFVGPEWMAADPKKPHMVYLVDNREVIRVLDTEKREVSRLISKGQAQWYSLREIGFTQTGDTLLVANEQDNETAVAMSMLFRKDDYKKPAVAVRGRKNNSVAPHPICKELYFSERNTGTIFKHEWDWAPEKRESLFIVGGNDSQIFIVFHPTGDYAYFVIPPRKRIYKADYDWINHTLKAPVEFCGNGSEGCIDGLGLNAKLGNPMQGVFVYNQKYADAGKEDCYDFYFADQYSHAIRYVTPEAYVHTFAGRGSKGLDKNPYGYVDGDLLEEARFNQPAGIAFDPENQIFYVADKNNKRIRVIDLNGE